MNAAIQQRLSVFEQAFGRPSTSFKTVAEVNEFLEQKGAAPAPNVQIFSENNLVLPQGNVFPISPNDIDSMIDRALVEQTKCLKRFR